MNRNTWPLAVALGLIVFCGILTALRPLGVLPSNARDAAVRAMKK
jgi:hypothetical protein